uniref:Pre-mRNA-splicing regulator n=1 Tax=Anoplophora glabripennis TaxID=217634 RepID=V5GU83_ANOGL
MSESGDVPQPSSPADRDRAPSRVLVADQEMGTLTPLEWQNRWRQQESYVTNLERKTSQQEGELAELRQTSERLKAQLLDSQQREKVLVRRLTAKEQEMQDYVVSSNCRHSQMFLTLCPVLIVLRVIRSSLHYSFKISLAKVDSLTVHDAKPVYNTKFLSVINRLFLAVVCYLKYKSNGKM